MRVGERGLRNEVTSAEEIPRGRNEVSCLVPKVGESKHGSVKDEDYRKDDCEIGELLKPRFARRGVSRFVSRGGHCDLVNGSLGHVGIEFNLSECLLVVSEILLEHQRESFCLLWAEVDSVKILDLDAIVGLGLQGSEGEMEIPHAHAYLNTVRVGITIIAGFSKGDLRLFDERHKNSPMV